MGIAKYVDPTSSPSGLSPVCSRTEYLEEDANIAGMDDYKQPANKLVHCFLESSVPAFVSVVALLISAGEVR